MVFDPTGKEHLLMDNSENIYRYIHAGKGRLTLVAPTLKAHEYTFEFPSTPSDFDEGTIFVYVLHDGHRMYVGKLTNAGVNITRSSKFGPDTEAYKGANYIARMSMSQELVDKTPMKLYQSGKCCMCGREMAADKTLKQGIGPKCAKIYAEWAAKIPWDGNS